MMRFLKIFNILVFGFFLLVLVVCVYKFSRESEMEFDGGERRVQQIFSKTRSICFGRFVMNVPLNVEVVYGDARVHSRIERIPGWGEKMEEWLSRRLKNIEQEKDYAYEDLTEGGDALYGKIVNGVLPEQKIVFGVDKASGSAYRVESVIRLGNDLFVQETVANVARYAGKYGNAVSEAVKRLNEVAMNLRIRAEDEIPGEVGVCIDGAFISKPLGVSGENFRLGVRFKDFPDVHFSIDTRVSNVDIERETIGDVLRRQQDAESDACCSGHGAWYAGIKFLRRGERGFNGGKGYELLARKPAQGDGAENHQFIFEGGGEANNELRPAFDMQMDTGADEQHTARVRPSLTDEEAVALWDALISSIRVRPTSGPKTSQSPLPRVSLGTLHVTGHRCPQTGWWECHDELNLAQPSGIWLEQGKLMPKALVWAQPNLWDRLKGERPVGWTAAVWRLAGYEEPQAPGGGQAG